MSSTMIKFDLKELRKLVNEKDSCVCEKKVTQNLALQPWCLGNLKESLKALLDYKIGKFDKETNGILMSYKNLRVLHNIGTIKNDNADIHFQVQADYFIFKPYVGSTLRGTVIKKSYTHLAVLVHRVFNVVIPRPTEEPGNTWIGAEIQEGQDVVFRVVVLDLFGALPYIRGEIDKKWFAKGPETEEIEKNEKNCPVNDTFVNFDKTKPSHKPGDESRITPASTSSVKQTKNVVMNKAKKNESDASVPEKNKNKRINIRHRL